MLASRSCRPARAWGFPAGTDDAHQIRNRSDKDVLLLAIGDRSEGDVVTYPDVNMHLTRGQSMFHKDGRSRGVWGSITTYENNGHRYLYLPLYGHP